MADPKTGAAMGATLSVASKSLAGLRPWVGDALAGVGPVEAKLTAKGGGNAYRLAPFELAIGSRSVTAKLEIDGTAEPPAAMLDVQGDKPMIEPLVAGTVAGGMIEGDMGDADADDTSKDGSAEAPSRQHPRSPIRVSAPLPRHPPA